MVNCWSVKIVRYNSRSFSSHETSLFATCRVTKATPIFICLQPSAGDSASAHRKERRRPRSEPLPAVSAHPAATWSQATELQESVNLLPWNQGRVLCSSVPLFGHHGMAFAHESRTGPFRGFDYKNGSIRRPCRWFRGPHISVSGCTVVWHFSWSQKGCLGMIYGTMNIWLLWSDLERRHSDLAAGC